MNGVVGDVDDGRPGLEGGMGVVPAHHDHPRFLDLVPHHDFASRIHLHIGGALQSSSQILIGARAWRSGSV